MKRFLASILTIAAFAIAFGTIAGCEDDVKRVKKVERHEESPPQMVAPGEPIVE